MSAVRWPALGPPMSSAARAECPRSNHDGEPFPPRRFPRSPAPPARGVPLSVRLGLVTSLVVVSVIGVLTFVNQQQEIGRDRRALEAQLAESLAPLAFEVEQAVSIDHLQSRVRTYQQGFASRGHPDTRLAIRDHHGQIVTCVPAPGEGGLSLVHTLTASVTVTSPFLPTGTGVLTLSQDGSAFAAEVARRWHFWRLSLLLTALCIAASLQVAIYFLLTRPLGRLVRQLKKLEAGYICDIEPGYGAWEIRWLGWQCHRLCLDLSESVRRLVRAERLGHDLPPLQPAGPPASDAADHLAEREDRELERSLVRHYLLDRCRLLESLPPQDPATRAVAEDAWSNDIVEAERFGETDLKARLENAALRLLDPGTFEEVSRAREALVAARNGWPKRVAERIGQALGEDSVPFVQIQHRVKHAAGIWRKMRERGLGVGEVQDIFAFRVIVADEPSCYAALRAIHRFFEPELFRFKDYIAEPKQNGYQSLHTTVRDGNGLVFEIQIRSLDMHHAAERGASAHWRYLAGKVSAPDGSEPAAHHLRGWLSHLRSTQ